MSCHFLDFNLTGREWQWKGEQWCTRISEIYKTKAGKSSAWCV